MQSPDLEPEVEPPGEPDPESCVACGSPNIRRRPRWLYFGLVVFMAVTTGVATEMTEAAFFVIAAAAIFAVIADRWGCEECGTTWK